MILVIKSFNATQKAIILSYFFNLFHVYECLSSCMYIYVCAWYPCKSEEDDMELELRMAVSDHVGTGI